MHKYLAAGAAGGILIAGATLIRAADEKARGILRLGPALDPLISPGTAVEKIASGFQFTEGPLWRPDGHLWFSEVTGNVLRSLTAAGTVDVLIRNAGGESNAPPGAFVWPNGMTADKDGSASLCKHTNRRIVRVGSDLRTTVYLDTVEGKRFNSPNDLVFRADGSLYFTDPPFGLPKQDQDAAKELPFNGFFRYANHRLQVVIRDLPRPNGIAFSPGWKHSLRLQFRGENISDGLQSRARRFSFGRPHVAGCQFGAEPGRAGRHESGFKREPLCGRARRRLGSFARRQASRNNSASRDRGQLRMARRRALALHLPRAAVCTAYTCRSGAKRRSIPELVEFDTLIDHVERRLLLRDGSQNMFPGRGREGAVYQLKGPRQ